MNQPNHSIGLLILGMHRSGTSALAGALETLGINLSNNLFEADPAINERGYWENKSIVDLNNRILAHLKSSWSDPRPLPTEWWLTPGIKSFQDEAQTIIDTEFSDSPIWAIKDPRVCKLLPFWQQILAARRQTTAYVLILRDPREVAKSLAQRDSIRTEHASLLWLEHVLEAERGTRGMPRVILTYDELLSDWQKVALRVNELCEYRLPTDSDHINKAPESFLSQKLKHHHAELNPQWPCEKLAFELYLSVVRGEDISTAADKSQLALSHLREILMPWIADAGSLRSRIFELETILDSRGVSQQERELAHLQKEIERVKTSISWRITAPLRVAWNLLRRVLPRRNG